jgi:ankyrin repeat protein
LERFVQELHIAAGKPGDDLDEIKRLLSSPDCDVNAICPKTKKRAIHIAAQADNFQILRYLIEQANAELDASQCDNLITLVLNGKPKIHRAQFITYLTRPDLKLYRRFNDGTTDLHAAALAGDADRVFLILKQAPELKDQVNRCGKLPLFYALNSGSIRTIDQLLNEGEENKPLHNGLTPLLFSIRQGYIETVEWLIKKNADINLPCLSGSDEGITPIFAAALLGKHDIFKLLISLGCNVKSSLQSGRWKGGSPITTAIRYGHIEVVKLILEREVWLYEPSKIRKIIFLAASCGHIEIFKFLFEQSSSQGIDPNSALEQTMSENDGFTPLFMAACYGHKEIVEFLIAQGADYKQGMKFGQSLGLTPLWIAITNNHIDVVKSLIQNQVDFLEPLQEGVHKDHTAVHAAISSNKQELINLFINLLQASKISLNDISLGKPVLHFAIEHLLINYQAEKDELVSSNIATIRLLIAKGANPDIRDAQDLSAFDRVRDYAFFIPCLLTNVERDYLEPLIHNSYSKDFLKQMLSPLIEDDTIISVSNQEKGVDLQDYLLEQLKVLKSFYEIGKTQQKHYYSERYQKDLLEIIGARMCPFANEHYDEVETLDECSLKILSHQKTRLIDVINSLIALNHYFYVLDQRSDYRDELPTVRLKEADLKRKHEPEKKAEDQPKKRKTSIEQTEIKPEKTDENNAEPQSDLLSLKRF